MNKVEIINTRTFKSVASPGLSMPIWDIVLDGNVVTGAISAASAESLRNELVRNEYRFLVRSELCGIRNPLAMLDEAGKKHWKITAMFLEKYNARKHQLSIHIEKFSTPFTCLIFDEVLVEEIKQLLPGITFKDFSGANFVKSAA